jgi:hypothetical protein
VHLKYFDRIIQEDKKGAFFLLTGERAEQVWIARTQETDYFQDTIGSFLN